MLPYGRQEVTEEDIQAVCDVLRSDYLTTGPTVEEFEKALCEVTGYRYAAVVNSGTAALHLACLAAGVGPGDEVILPTLTFCATANAVLHCGGIPVLCDVGDDLTIDVERAKLLITPRTRAVISVDFAGLPARHDEIRMLGVFGRYISDSAHSLGAKYEGCSQWANAATLSFHPVKHITAGEGGAVLSDTKEWIAYIKGLRSHDQHQANRHEPWFRWTREPGYNYRMPDINAALGLSQLKRLPQNLARRRELAAMYDHLLGDIDDLILPPRRDGSEHAFHIYPIQLPERADRKQVYWHMKEHGIGAQIHYKPLHQQRMHAQPRSFPVADRYYRRCLTLPLFPAMSDSDTETVVAVLREALR